MVMYIDISADFSEMAATGIPIIIHYRLREYFMSEAAPILNSSGLTGGDPSAVGRR